MRIGIDIDGVLFPWTDVANEAVMERFGVPDPGPHVEWEHLKNLLTRDQWGWLWTAEGQDVVFGQIERTYPGAVEAVNAITRHGEHEVHFVTHRDPRRAGVHTAAFLALHFGAHPWAGTHVIQAAMEKHRLARWDVFIDDKPETIWDFVANTDAEVFTPARPWNTELADDGWIHRYEDPQEIVEALGRYG